MKVAVFPGSFDPFTLGHYSVVNKALNLFDKLIIAIGINANKKSFFTIEEKLKMLSKLYENESKIQIDSYDCLTADYCNSQKARFIIRGLRNSQDLEYERTIAQMNSKISKDIETIFFLCDPEYSYINSSMVREVYKYGGDVSQFLPKSLLN